MNLAQCSWKGIYEGGNEGAPSPSRIIDREQERGTGVRRALERRGAQSHCPRRLLHAFRLTLFCSPAQRCPGRGCRTTNTCCEGERKGDLRSEDQIVTKKGVRSRPKGLPTTLTSVARQVSPMCLACCARVRGATLAAVGDVLLVGGRRRNLRSIFCESTLQLAVNVAVEPRLRVVRISTLWERIVTQALGDKAAKHAAFHALPLGRLTTPSHLGDRERWALVIAVAVHAPLAPAVLLC